MNLSPRLIEHAGQFAAGFELISGNGLHEQENALKRQLDSFIVVEKKFSPDFNEYEFLVQVVALITCKIQAREVWIDCNSANTPLPNTQRLHMREVLKKH